MPQILLASTSIFRQQLLSKLDLPFECIKPDVDETPLTFETPQEMVQRLALAKAQAPANSSTQSLIIGSDQCAVFAGKPIGKPHHFEKAQQQLKAFSGQSIDFYTGLAVYDTATQKTYQALDHTVVHFRTLSDEVITRYLEREQPLNCAGSFKSEGLGITLFKRIDSRDPNALIGLPLIALTDIFYELGYPLPY
ncbi:MAG: septum formation inhibitor Maf [Thiotrichales bacterium]|nr:septum formation inhibitor Maf [Thiotrichales bacterium]